MKLGWRADDGAKVGSEITVMEARVPKQELYCRPTVKSLYILQMTLNPLKPKIV
jgi:hypothetical protein